MGAPPVRLGLLLQHARSRGIRFDGAWKLAVVVALQDVPEDEQVAWAMRFSADRRTWRRAYERQPPTPREQAAARLAETLAHLERV